jgi:hypothetical protein
VIVALFVPLNVAGPLRIENVTGSPELAVAVSVICSPTLPAVGCGKLIVCAMGPESAIIPEMLPV